MKVSDAFTLAAKISYFYNQKSSQSNAINVEISFVLGPSLYLEFCQIVNNPINDNRDPLIKRDFTKECFFDDSILTDLDVSKNFKIDWIMESLSKVTSNQ